jgi:hypothetical protein
VRWLELSFTGGGCVLPLALAAHALVAWQKVLHRQRVARKNNRVAHIVPDPGAALVVHPRHLLLEAADLAPGCKVLNLNAAVVALRHEHAPLCGTTTRTGPGRGEVR